MQQQVPTRAFHVMAKPSGSDCNLNCDYCFYLEKQSLYREKPVTHMDDDTLEAYVRHYIAASEPQNEVAFTWQGGEPTLLGLDFYRRAVKLQAKYGAGRKISNSFQTNGVLLDDEWCAFLAENHFLVGLSLDGPAEIHNQYRVTKGGRPTHKLVMRALTLLQKHHVDYNVLVCVNRATALHGLLVPTAPLSVNLLARDQQDVSAAFGGGVPQEERFRIGEWREGPDGVPELVGAQANLACVIDAMLAYGTHSIVIARVLRATVSDAVTPLIYQDGAYL